MNEAEELIEIPNKNLKLLEKSFSNFKNQLYEKQFGDDYKATTKEEDSNSFEKINSEDFYIYILFHTYLFYKKNRFLIDHGNTKYESIPFDLKKLDENKKMTQSNLQENYEGFIKLTKWDKVFFISRPMLNFCNDFIENKMFNIPFSYEDKLEELSVKSFDQKSLEEILEIKKEIKNRLLKGAGFYQLYNISNNNIKQFHSLVRNSMKQFYYSLPTDNPIFDRVSKNALNIVSPGIASGWNKDVEKAVVKAKSELNVDFQYDSGINDIYASFSINLPAKKYEENTNLRIQIILEELQKNHREFKKDNWRPFSSMNLVLALKNSALQLGGYVYIFELKRALKTFLAKASSQIPPDLLVSRFVYKEGREYDVLDFTQSYEFSGAQAEYDKYENKFLVFIEQLSDSKKFNIKDFISLGSILEKEYFEYREKIKNNLVQDRFEFDSEDFEFFDEILENKIINIGKKPYKIFRELHSFIKKLEEPIHTEISFEAIILFYIDWFKKFKD